MYQGFSHPRTHASSGLTRTPAGLPITCMICRLRWPTISVANLDNDVSPGIADPYIASLTVSGTSFTPGDPVQVTLMAQDGSGAVMAAGDTTASLALTLPLGNGQYVHTPGGQFTIDLVPDPNSQTACTVEGLATVVATDQVTGAQATISISTLLWWNHNSLLPQACPTVTPVG
jgi:hypothetical protein